MQQNLFIDSAIEWNQITDEWLLNYLQSNYSNLKFIILKKIWGNGDEIRQTITKKADLRLYIDNTDKNKLLIHITTEKKQGNYEGQSLAVNNFDDFYKQLPQFIEQFLEYKK